MHLKLLSCLLIFALLNSCIELEISAPSFPDIINHFHISSSKIGMTITYNLIGFCTGSLICGPLADQYGRRKIMLWGNGILMGGALGCTIAPAFNILLISRLFQGIGAATSAVIVSTIIADVYPFSKAKRLYGFMNAIFTLVMAASPIIGGLLNKTLGWRGNYGIVALISIFSWILLYLFLPETKPTSTPLCLRKLKNHYTHIALHAPFLRAAIIPSLLYGCYLTFVSLAPFIYIRNFGTSPDTYILNQSIIIITFALTSAISHKFPYHLGTQHSIYLGLGLSVLGSILMLFSSGPYILTTAMCSFCSGFAILYPIIFAYSLEIFPHYKGVASSIIISLRYFLCSCMTGLINCLYNQHISNLYISILIVTTLVALLCINLIKELKGT